MGSSRKRVFVLDSDAEFLVAMEKILEDEGFEAVTAWNARELSDFLAGREFDLLVVSDHPPDLSCPEILKQLRSTGTRVPCIVLLHASRHPFEAAYLCSLGAYAVMSKQKHREIVGKIRQCLGDPERTWEQSALAG